VEVILFKDNAFASQEVTKQKCRQAKKSMNDWVCDDCGSRHVTKKKV